MFVKERQHSNVYAFGKSGPDAAKHLGKCPCIKRGVSLRAARLERLRLEDEHSKGVVTDSSSEELSLSSVADRKPGCFVALNAHAVSNPMADVLTIATLAQDG